ncbi:sugar phosphate isomerase/epimerase family protein [Actomonas aquatica]|uniref:TIM barrel protein n=1 Tax=Actomonas aquatica TaxID=2866162 RepID=A0ABZ1CD12_9BACT|nr:TIM barrel protein [Opitutus sp. WL0086]WRQ89561.1 TIM barrel protein [Opitutus sp. WL0086]
MSYQRCYSTLGNPAATLSEALAVASNFDLDAVELRTLEGRLDLPALFTARFGSPAALADQLGDQRLRIRSLDTSLRLLTNTAADRAEFLEFLPWAEALGVRWLRLFDGGENLAADLPGALDTFHWWHEQKQRHDWQADIMIETHDALLSSDAILALAGACPGIGILWDSHHTWKKGGESPVTTWQKIRDHVVHIHVKESISQPSAKHPFSYVLPGQGEFPMAELQPLLAAEFAGAVSLEWERHWHPELAPLEAALQSAQELKWW